MGSAGSTTESETMSLDTLVKDIAGGRYSNVVIMCGAGISTSAGIPDFRTPSAGLYFKLRKYNLPYPEAVFEGRYFRQDPKPFYGLVREIFPENISPTTTHQFFSLLHKKGLLRRIYTQNIDALEYLAGVPEDKIVEAHGSFKSGYCTACSETYDLSWLKHQIFNGNQADGVPRCAKCGGVVRPDVVLFGEALPARFWSNIDTDFKACDLLLVFGTSLVVSPFNTLVGKPGKSVPRVYINKTKPGATGSLLGWFMSMGANVDFSRLSDLQLLGDCDRQVEEVCQRLGWDQQLKDIKVLSLDTLTDDASKAQTL